MKAAFIEKQGPPEELRIDALREPEIGPAQALVRVRATTVNPIDTYLRSGAIGMKISLPWTPGCDVAGVVERIGAEVKNLKPGDRVWGSNLSLLGRQGATAELVAVDAHWLYPIPENATVEEAAAIALVGLTAWIGLFRDAHLKPGETLFVSGGTGGVGSLAVQMGKAAGAKVIATAGSEEKAERCRDLGADHVILYKSDVVSDRARTCAPLGVDVWLETTRDPHLETNIPLLAMGGRMVLMAGRDARPTLPIGNFYTRDCKLLGFAMFNASPEIQRHAANDINRWLEEGKLKAQIGKTMGMDEIVEAHRLQEQNTLHAAGTLSGKIVITVP